jgi:IS605 OrfB family transposase
MQRTIRVRLKPTPEQVPILLDTLHEHAACFNAVTAYGFEHGEKNGVELHKATYYPLRAEHPTLPAQLVCAARVRATEAVRSALTRKRQGRKVSTPHSELPPIRYDARTYRVLPDHSAVSLSTTSGRQVFAVQIPDFFRSNLDAATGFDSADLIKRKGRFWLHIVVTLLDVPFTSSGQVVGIDLGIVRPAVTSTNHFFGQRRWRELEARYFRLRRALQAKGTRSARRHLRRLAGKQLRLRRDMDHQLSRQIVNSVEPGSTIVVENLVNIRSPVKQRHGAQMRRLHGWSFDQLRGFLTYKAEEKGCIVVGVDPRHTSQTCPVCGFAYRHNRRSQSEFCCRSCGYQSNADRVGALNIAAKYLAGPGISETGGLPSESLSRQPGSLG